MGNLKKETIVCTILLCLVECMDFSFPSIYRTIQKHLFCVTKLIVHFIKTILVQAYIGYFSFPTQEENILSIGFDLHRTMSEYFHFLIVPLSYILSPKSWENVKCTLESFSSMA